MFLLRGGRQATALTAIVATAVLVRLLFFNGPLGSDDLTYLGRALEIANGIWTTSNYNGGLRYGFNIPAGLTAVIFGGSAWAVNLWPFFCSIAEVGIVWWFSYRLWGRSAGVAAALLLTFAPLHVALATRIHADPVVALFLTLSFVLFYFAEQSKRSGVYFSAGLAMGAVFWVKELAVVALFCFLAYPMIMRRVDARWVWAAGGGVVMLMLHFLLMQVIAGDPFHLFRTVLGQVSRDFIAAGSGEDGALYYFKYLFVDVKHSWLLGFFATAGLISMMRTRAHTFAVTYAAFWALGLVCVLSFMPVSVDPIRLVMKQSNYLSLFLAPLAVVAAFWIKDLPARLKAVVLAVYVLGGLALAGLQQAAYQNFTANSRALVKMASGASDGAYVGSKNNASIASFYSAVGDDGPVNVTSFTEVVEKGVGEIPAHKVLYAVIDRETMAWGRNAVVFDQPLDCWSLVGKIVPSESGTGGKVVTAALSAARILPADIEGVIGGALSRIQLPKPAEIYVVNGPDVWCGNPPVSPAKR